MPVKNVIRMKFHVFLFSFIEIHFFEFGFTENSVFGREEIYIGKTYESCDPIGRSKSVDVDTWLLVSYRLGNSDKFFQNFSKGYGTSDCFKVFKQRTGLSLLEQLCEIFTRESPTYMSLSRKWKISKG